jgi:hypothetical protein
MDAKACLSGLDKTGDHSDVPRRSERGYAEPAGVSRNSLAASSNHSGRVHDYGLSIKYTMPEARAALRGRKRLHLRLRIEPRQNRLDRHEPHRKGVAVRFDGGLQKSGECVALSIGKVKLHRGYMGTGWAVDELATSQANR